MKIAIADDHPIFRSGLEFLLKSTIPNVAVHSFENGQEVINAYPSLMPDLLFLDIDMPVLNGLETCINITENYPDSRVIILSIHKQADMIKLAFFNGAKGYLIKDNTSEELLECVTQIQKGQTYLPLELRNLETQKQADGFDSIRQKLTELTPTELKVLHLVSDKFSSKEIAERLFVSPKSVENYRSRICKKLDLDARNNNLILWVMEHRFLLLEHKKRE